MKPPVLRRPFASLALSLWRLRELLGARLGPALGMTLASGWLAGCADYPPLPQVVVNAGESIQRAIAIMPKSAATWVIQVKPGVYHESLSIDRDGISLLGEVTGTGFADRPVLDGTLAGGGQLSDAVRLSGAYFTMQGFTVRSYSGSGVTASKTHNLVLRDLVADHAGQHGFYPVESQDVLIDSCVATGHRDAGIAVSQSQRATVQGCATYQNVAGIEIENSVDATVLGNESSGNTAGILTYVLPSNPSKVGQNCLIRYNDVHDNNLASAGDKATLLGKVPAGVGIAVMAADATTVQDNVITGNRSVGVAIVGLDRLLGDPTGLDVEPNPDSTTLSNNSYADNGQDPDPALKALGFLTGGDILWDGKGKGNCLDESQGDLAKAGAAGTLPVCP